MASFGRESGELAVLREVLTRHPAVVRVTDNYRFPQRIDWDFYGVVAAQTKVPNESLLGTAGQSLV